MGITIDRIGHWSHFSAIKANATATIGAVPTFCDKTHSFGTVGVKSIFCAVFAIGFS